MGDLGSGGYAALILQNGHEDGYAASRDIVVALRCAGNPTYRLLRHATKHI